MSFEKGLDLNILRLDGGVYFRGEKFGYFFGGILVLRGISWIIGREKGGCGLWRKGSLVVIYVGDCWIEMMLELVEMSVGLVGMGFFYFLFFISENWLGISWFFCLFIIYIKCFDKIM